MKKISICIPAYKRTDYLKRLLHSISVQNFQDFDVVVTDDSPTEEVSALCEQYEDKFTLYYFRNQKPLGTPENWNEAIRHATGQWIKLMHDDDWFSRNDSLQKFADAIEQYPNEKFFFSAYNNVFAGTERSEEVQVNLMRFKHLLKEPATLFSSNIIGPPSVILHRNDKEHWYDMTIKWVVDIDFYIRYLKDAKPVYINEPLVNVGINKEQVTQSSFRVAEVEIPENFYLLKKVGSNKLKNILVYDAFWRLVRNLKIKNVAMIRSAGYDGEVPKSIRSMIDWQKHLPQGLLNIGPVSKTLMLLSYFKNRRKN